MGALTFDKRELANLEYSLKREMLATDRRGGYMSTTLVCCNTRKYHGLMVTTIDESERDYVLLSSLGETLILNGQRFNLALRRYRGAYEPKGHKYITDFEYTPTPTLTYRIADMVLKKELLWIHKKTQLMVRYTLLESAEESVTMQLTPFLAFRDRHALSKANLEADTRSYPVAGGVKCRLYDGFPWLYMQINSGTEEFVPAPDWHYDFEYQQEIERGYEGYEDLLTPGYFEVALKRGESVIFSASTEESYAPKNISLDYEMALARRTHKIDFLSCLRHSARQFLVRRQNGDAEIVAGYPWYSVVGREQLISLPGLTIEQGHKEDCIDVLDSMIRNFHNGTLKDTLLPRNATDTMLWFFRVLQELENEVGAKMIWERYGEEMKNILCNYRANESTNVALHDNGLIWADGSESVAWEDPTLDREVWGDLTSRRGYLVEVNALWYNAVCYTLELATKYKDKAFVEEWNWIPERAKSTFQTLFWLGEGWLSDYVNHTSKGVAARPNMVIACALKYKMVSEEQQIDILRVIQQQLLTRRGLRSLSPQFVHLSRRDAAKSGSVWVWSLMFYVRACFDIMGEAFIGEAQSILDGFKEQLSVYGIGSIAEYYEAKPPHKPRGAISQAWSVAALLEIAHMIEQQQKLSAKATKRAATAAKKSETAPKKRVTKRAPKVTKE